ncbi:MAG: tape measure protein [Methylocystis sp.]
MTDSAHSISISVDASAGVSSLKQLQTAVRDTSTALKDLGSSAGAGGGFAQLTAQMNQLSAGFDRLKNQASSINNINANIGRMSASPIKAISNELGLLATIAKDAESAFGLLETALAGAALAKFGEGILKAGNALLSTRFSLDSVATSATEAAGQLKFIEQVSAKTGSSLEDNIEVYRNLAVSMRALGRPVEEIQKVFEGFSTALSVQHVSVAQQKILFKELAETYSQGAVHATQALRSMGSHLPGMSALLQEALGKTGEQLHKMFQAGGLPPTETWSKAAEILQTRFGPQLSSALDHSTASLNILSNTFTKLKQVSFDSGFDAGLTALAKAATDSQANIEHLGKAIGSTFGDMFTGAAKAVTVLREFAGPLKDFAEAVVGIRAVTLSMNLLSVASRAAFSPLVILAGAFVLIKENWTVIGEAFSHAGEVFDSANAALERYTGGWMSLKKAMLGAVETWALAKGLLAGKSLDESKSLGAQAGVDFQSGKDSGAKFFDGVYTEAKSYVKQVRDIFSDLLPESGTKNIEEEWKRIDAMSKPHKEGGAGQYDSNKKHYDEINADRALSTELEKLFLKLNPVTAALKTYREELEKINSMRGKTLDGKVIDDSQINAMKASAQQTALKDFAPQTEKIQSLMDAVKIERDARAAVGDEKDALESERAVLTWKNEMLRKNVSVTTEEVNAVRELLKAQAAFGKESESGFKKFVDESKDVTKTLNDSIKSSMDSIAEGISKIVVDGKGKFKNLGQAIRAELKDILKGQAKKLIDAGIKGLMSQAITSLGLDKIGGADGAAALKNALGLGSSALDSAGKRLDDSVKTVNDMAVTASVVNITGVGALNGANTGSAFGTGGGNGNSVGGITPTPLAPTVPTFGSSAITSPNGLGAIPSNSASMFGASLTPALAPIAALATSIKTGASNAGIDVNSIASFGRAINLQNPAPVTPSNLGVAPLGDTSASIMKQLMDQGATPKQASTLTAQFAGEAGGKFDPRARSKNDGGPGNDSIGISQWNNGKNNDTINGRKALMMRDVERQTGKPYDSVGTDELRHAQTNYALKEAQTPRYKGAWDSIGQHPGNEGAAFGRRFEGYDPSTQHGDAWRNQKQLELERKANGLQNPKPSAGIDNTPTGSIKPVDLSKTLDPSLKASANKWEDDMAKASKASSGEFTQDISKDLKSATTSGNGGGAGFGTGGSGTGSSNSGLGDTGNSGNAGGLSGDASGALSSIASLGGGIAKLGSQSKLSAQGVASLVPQLASLLAKLASGLGGSLGGAGGAAASAGGGLFGMFKDGGISDSPTASMWIGAPRFADGGISDGGIPSILHPNEAIIPLKNHAVPVDLQGAGQGNVTHNHFNSNTNVTTANADSFRQSRQQIMSEMNKQMARFAARNN